MTGAKKVNFNKKLHLFHDLWSPKVIAQMNDYQFKLVKVNGDFVWHDHADTDETFIVLNGTLFIEFSDNTMELHAGEMTVVPKGVQHRPYANEECHILLVEPTGVVNTGEKENELTAENDVWI